MRLQRLIEYTFPDRDILRLAGMLPLMKKQPSRNLESLTWIRIERRKRLQGM
jgi:hypothetical protein